LYQVWTERYKIEFSGHFTLLNKWYYLIFQWKGDFVMIICADCWLRRVGNGNFLSQTILLRPFTESFIRCLLINFCTLEFWYSQYFFCR
jgi:hypothetical protein